MRVVMFVYLPFCTGLLCLLFELMWYGIFYEEILVFLLKLFSFVLILNLCMTDAYISLSDVEISRKGHMLTPPVPFSSEGSCSDIGKEFRRKMELLQCLEISVSRQLSQVLEVSWYIMIYPSYSSFFRTKTINSFCLSFPLFIFAFIFLYFGCKGVGYDRIWV